MNPGVDVAALRRDLDGLDARFDDLARALYSTDASVYQIRPVGVVVPRSTEELRRIVVACGRHRCPITMRGGGTSQAGQAIGPGLIVDSSKYLARLLEVDVPGRWARIEPGIVLDELNGALAKYQLRFAPDISSASRATVGGMIANNSAGARSVVYGKTIDHVLELEVLLSDGTVAWLRPVSGDELERLCEAPTLEGACYREVRRLGRCHAEEIERRFPKVLRRVGGYNLDEFVDDRRPFDLTRIIVGSEGTLAIVLEAKIRLVPVPPARVLMAVQFADLLDALAATPGILRHGPSAVEAMDAFILGHTAQNADLHRLRQSFVQGEPAALLCVEFAGERTGDLIPKLEALEADLRSTGRPTHFCRAIDSGAQQAIWHVREAALGLSMAMKGDAKAISFVEDAAVAPTQLRDYVRDLLAVVGSHGTAAGVYAHASVGCLHVRPVINMKAADGIRAFEAIASAAADLALKYGGTISGEHGDGLVRSPFMERMFGPILYEAFRSIKRTFDPDGLLNPGKIVDAPPITANLRFGPGYTTAQSQTTFDYREYGGLAGAAEMCSGLGACRKTHAGTMCPSFMATREEEHSTRGRANALRLVLSGQLGRDGLADEHVREVLDLCLECRACRTECPVGVDVGRMKSEFLAAYWRKRGTPLRARMLGNIHRVAAWGSRLAAIANPLGSAAILRHLGERLFDVDRRRRPPRFAARTLRQRLPITPRADGPVLFVDTFANHFHPEVGLAAHDVMLRLGVHVSVASNVCCGRPLVSQGLLDDARRLARENALRLAELARSGRPIIVLEPSCLSMLREDAPDLLSGEERQKALDVARMAQLFETWLENECAAGRLKLTLRDGPSTILLHGHCHQKSMGELAPAKALLGRVPRAAIHDPDAGCCGMAGSFGYLKSHYDVSKAIGERRLLPAVRSLGSDAVLVASGTSCRQQILDFTGVRALHAAELVQNLLTNP